jgi:hypothetical protein
MPVLATLSLAGFYVLTSVSAENAIQRFGRVTPWSVGVFLLTLAFAAFALMGLVLALRFRNRPMVWWHAFAASLVLTVVALYMAYWGMIGWRPWA